MRVLIVFFLFLAACNTPSPGFRGVKATQVTVDGSTFDVRIKGLRAEAIRTNMQYAPRLGPIGNRAAKAMAQVSGCKVHDYTGDQALIIARLNCGDGPPAKRGRALRYDCEAVTGLNKNGDVVEAAEIECTAQARAP